MIALNAFFDFDKIHIYTDGGHYIENDVVHFGAKVLPLPFYNAVLVWSGPSEFLPILWNDINKSKLETLVDLINTLSKICGGLSVGVDMCDKFTAVVAGFMDTMPIGVIVEEGDKVAYLYPGASVIAVPCDEPFNYDDPINSGLSIMEKQRIVCPVISGFCKYDLLTAESQISTVIKRWD